MTTSTASRSVVKPDPDLRVDAPVDRSGRWVGGAIGSLASAAVGLASLALGRFANIPLLDGAALICALGIPIAFVLGRHLFPIARVGHRRSAVWVAMQFALMAPPLGAIEIVAGLALAKVVGADPASFGPPDPFSALAGLVAFLAIAIPCSYIAAPVTVAVGLVWLLGVRFLPATAPR